jgi:hypothetical protein
MLQLSRALRQSPMLLREHKFGESTHTGIALGVGGTRKLISAGRTV